MLKTITKTYEVVTVICDFCETDITAHPRFRQCHICHKHGCARGMCYKMSALFPYLDVFVCEPCIAAAPDLMNELQQLSKKRNEVRSVLSAEQRKLAEEYQQKEDAASAVYHENYDKSLAQWRERIQVSQPTVQCEEKS